MALVVNYPAIIERYAPQFKDHFSKEDYEHFKRYLSGILLSNNKTVEGISRLFVLDPIHQSTLNRFLKKDTYDIEALHKTRISWLQQNPKTTFKSSGVLIIDNSLLTHYGCHMDHIQQLYDHVTQSHVIAHDLVTLHYADTLVNYPITNELWKPLDVKKMEEALLAEGVKLKESKQILKTQSPRKWKQYLTDIRRRHKDKPEVAAAYDTKIDIAIRLLRQHFANYPDCKLPTAMDTWYCVPEMHQFFEEAKRTYVMAIKWDEQVCLEGNKVIMIAQFIEKLKTEHLQNQEKGEGEAVFHKKGYREHVWKDGDISTEKAQEQRYCYIKTHTIKNIGRVRLLISYKSADLSDNPIVCICNELTLRAEDTLSIYRLRWPIEVFHEEGKAEGLDKYQLRDFTAINRHIAWVVFAYSFLQYAQTDDTFLKQFKQQLGITDGAGLPFLRRLCKAQTLLYLAQWIYMGIQNGLDYNDIIKPFCKAVAYT